MTERVILPEKLGRYEIGDHLDSGWGWDVYEAYVQAEGDHEARACHLRIFFNQPRDGHLHTHLTEARNKIGQHPHLHVQRIRDVEHVELTGRISAILVEEELLKEWSAPKPSDYRAVMIQLISAVEHLQKIGLPGIGLSKSNLARSRAGKAVLASLSPNWEQLWAGRSRAGEAEYYLRLPPESAVSPTEFEGAQWVYCAGSLLVEALVGTFPARSSSLEDDVFDTPISTYVNQKSDDFREAHLASLPEDIQAVLRRALAVKPEDRFENLTRFSEALETPIQTGKPGDRYVMPTSSAVQDVSPPPKNTFWGYALGGVVFGLLIAFIFWFVVINPSRREGATLSGSGPGVILEPDTDWKKDVQTPEPSAQVPVETGDTEPGPEEPAAPAKPEIVPEESQELAAQVPESSITPEPAELEPRPQPEPDQAVLDTGSPEPSEETIPVQEEPVVVAEEKPPAPIEDVDTPAAPEAPAAPVADPWAEGIDTIVSASSGWKDISDALSNLTWDEIKPQDRDRILARVPVWVDRQKTMTIETENLPSRSFVLDKIEAFWALSPESIQSLPEVTALLEDIEKRRLTVRIQVTNQTDREVSILDGEGKAVLSLTAGDSTVLEFPSGGETVVLRAGGDVAWIYSDRTFQSTPGGFFAWEFTELKFHPATVMPELPDSDDEIQVLYSKRESSEGLPLQGEIEVPPGDYRFTYTRPDYYPVTKVLRFSQPDRRYIVSLPSPEKWIPKPEMKQLLVWEELIASEPERVLEEMKAKSLSGLVGEGHQIRLALLQKSLDEQISSQQIQVQFAGADLLHPPVQVEVRDADGKPVTDKTAEKVNVQPGKYRVVFQRSDYEPIELDWLVLPLPKNIKLEFPAESDWFPSPALQKLRQLEKEMQGSGGTQTVRLIQELRNTQFESPEHESLYKRLRKEWYRKVVGL